MIIRNQSSTTGTTGAVGLQISAPIYNDPNQDDLLRLYGAISDAIEIGVMVYNTPWMSMQMAKRYGGGGVHSLGDHLPDTIVKMADFEHIVAITWSVSDAYEYDEMKRFVHIFNVIDNNTDVITCHKLGGRGYINTFNDGYPPHDIKIWELLESRQYDEALKLYNHPRTPEMAAFSKKVSVLMFSDSVLPNWSAKMSDYGDIDVDSEGAGKTSGPQQLTGRAHDPGPGGNPHGSERTPHQAILAAYRKEGAAAPRSW